MEKSCCWTLWIGVLLFQIIFHLCDNNNSKTATTEALSNGQLSNRLTNTRDRTRTTDLFTSTLSQPQLSTASAYSDSSFVLTLEYSPNFHRHIVRSHNGVVLESFPWLDQALKCYPKAAPQPLYSRKDDSDNDNESGENNQLFQVAGADSKLVQETYPTCALQNDDSLQCLYDFFQHCLSWFPQQVDHLLSHVPALTDWPLVVLKERIDFLLAPLPPDPSELLEMDPSTGGFPTLGAAPVDWPLLFYNDGYGAGMSVAQVTHGLLTIPQVLLRIKTTKQTVDTNDKSRVPFEPIFTVNQMAKFYQDTPAVVLQMTLRQLSYFLQGASNLDCATYSYLHFKGWKFMNIYIQLHAIPATLQASWETEAHLTGKRRNTPLTEEWLDFWQVRFQMRPSHIKALLRTHSRLSLYSVAHMERKVQWLSHHLGSINTMATDSSLLDTLHLRTLLFKSPSLVGMSIESLQERIMFWTERVGLSTHEIVNVILVHPSLLQYSVEDNLQPKLEFFKSKLYWNKEQIRSLTRTHPQVWGRSLEGHLEFLAKGLLNVLAQNITNMDDASNTKQEAEEEQEDWQKVGDILARAPELYNFNWQRNLKPKVDYLIQECGISITCTILSRSPRVLRQSLRQALHPKLEHIQSYGDDAQLLLLNTPSLLLLSMPNLEKRLERIMNPVVTPKANAKQACSKRAKRASRRAIVCMDETAIVFHSVDEAATHAGVSRSTMYSLLRTNRTNSRKRYTYQWMEDGQAESFTKSSTNKQVDNSLKSLASLTASIGPNLLGPDPKNDSFTKYLEIYVTARAFPSENVFRGRNRAGGMAFHVPTFVRDDWRKLVAALWKGQKLQVLPDGKSLLLGYNHFRPSRPRCVLFAIREALRAARVWIQNDDSDDDNNNKNEGDGDGDDDESNKYKIVIVTDSNYCLNLLTNQTRLMEWGHAKNQNEFVYNGPTQPHFSNPDILYPLSQSFCRLVEEGGGPNRVQVEFLKETLQPLSEGAQLAARRMYDSIQ